MLGWLATLTSFAQTNAPVVAKATNQIGSIEAKRAVINFFSGVGQFTTNVVVKDSEIQLTCQFLKVKFVVKNTNAPLVTTNQAAGPVWNQERVEWADAQGGVVILDEKNDMRIMGASAFFNATNNLLKLPGAGVVVRPRNATTNWLAAITNTTLVKPQTIFLGDDMVLDRVNGTISSENYKALYWGDLLRMSTNNAAKNPSSK